MIWKKKGVLRIIHWEILVIIDLLKDNLLNKLKK